VMLLLAMGAEIAMAGRTQIVLQWLDTAQGSMDLQEIYKVEEALEAVSSGKYEVDGHDVGSGTVRWPPFVGLPGGGSKLGSIVVKPPVSVVAVFSVLSRLRKDAQRPRRPRRA